MKIYKNIEVVDLALKYKDNLIIGDLHIGLEEALNKEGVLIPRFQLKEILEMLKKILLKVGIKRIIINGDLKHEFGTISEQEWRDTLQILDFLTEKHEVILIKGNHDTILDPIAKKRKVRILDYYKIDDIIILHGDKILPVKPRILIIGHEHPAINVKNKIRREMYKCFLKGRYKNSVLIVMPSFNFVTEGNDVLKEELLSPYLKDISKFEVFVIADKVYRFGKVEDLMTLK